MRCKLCQIKFFSRRDVFIHLNEIHNVYFDVRNRYGELIADWKVYRYYLRLFSGIFYKKFKEIHKNETVEEWFMGTVHKQDGYSSD